MSRKVRRLRRKLRACMASRGVRTHVQPPPRGHSMPPSAPGWNPSQPGGPGTPFVGYAKSGMSGLGAVEYGYRAPIAAVPSVITGRVFTPPSGMGIWQAAIAAAGQTATGIFQSKYQAGVDKTTLKANRDISIAQIRAGNVMTRQSGKSDRSMVYAGGAAVVAIAAIMLLGKKK